MANGNGIRTSFAPRSGYGSTAAPMPGQSSTPTGSGDDDAPCGCKAFSSMAELNECNVFRGDPVNFVQQVASTQCEAIQCAAGVGRGLVKIPFAVTAAPGATIPINIQFAREAYVWGIVFYQGAPNFDRQQWTFNSLSSSAQTQAWDVYAQASTFGTGGAQPFNPNTAALPLELLFEQGDNDLSNILHSRNFLPPLVTNSNVGDGNNSVNYNLTLSALAIAAQVATGWHYVYFPGKKKGS